MATLTITSRWISGSAWAGITATITYTVNNDPLTTTTISASTSSGFQITEPASGSGVELEQARQLRANALAKGLTYSFNCTASDGSNKEVFSIAINNHSSSGSIIYGKKSGSYSYTKTHSAQTKWCWVRLTNAEHVTNTFTVNAKPSYTITYNKNGGSNPSPATQTKWYGENLTLSSSTTRSDYTFLGWNTTSTATTVLYKNGVTYSNNSGLALYAIWKYNYTAPVLTIKSVSRCNSDGTVNDEGSYAKAVIAWSIYHNSANNNTATITMTCNNVSQTVTGSQGTYSGTTTIITNSNMLTDSAYKVTVEIHDSYQQSTVTTKSMTIPTTKYIIDVLHTDDNETGIAFGGAAHIKDTMDVNYKGVFNQGIKDPTGFDSRYQPINITNCDDAFNPYVNYYINSSASNRPPLQAWYLIRVLNSDNSHCVQLASSYGGTASSLWVRNRNGNAAEWGVWNPISKNKWKSVSETKSTPAGNSTVSLTTPFVEIANYSRKVSDCQTNSSNVIVAGAYIESNVVKLRVHNFSSSAINVTYYMLYEYLDDYCKWT